MELQRAKALLKTLSDGINPLTGEVLHPDDSANQADIIRALYTVLDALDYVTKEQSDDLSDNSGKPWTRKDEIKLCHMYDKNYAPDYICNSLKRSQEAVAAKLVKLGKTISRQEFRNRMK